MQPKRRSRRDPTLHFDGVFDAGAARRAEEALADASGEDALVIDVARVREFQDLAVAMLARAIAERPGARVELKGLRPHQARLLRYFGVAA